MSKNSIAWIHLDHTARFAWASLIASAISIGCHAAYIRHAAIAMQNTQDPSASYHATLAGNFGLLSMPCAVAAFGLICWGYRLRHPSPEIWKSELLALIAAITSGFVSLILV